MFLDLEYGGRQEAFRARLPDSGVTSATVADPGALETALLQALTELPRRWGNARRWGVDRPGAGVGVHRPRRLLAELEAALRAGGPTGMHAVTGMGGVGKTSIAIEYAHRHRAEFDIAWWVPAEDPALIPDRLAELARALDLTGETDPPALGVARLLGALAERDRWLIVFDNAEDPRALSPSATRSRPCTDHLPQPQLAGNCRPAAGARVHPRRVGGPAIGWHPA